VEEEQCKQAVEEVPVSVAGEAVKEH